MPPKIREILEQPPVTVGTKSPGKAATASSSTHQPGRVTVPGKPGDDVPPGTLNSILKQAGLKR
jgi:hypothetical protein